MEGVILEKEIRRAGVGRCGGPHAAWMLERAIACDRGVGAYWRQGQTLERCAVVWDRDVVVGAKRREVQTPERCLAVNHIHPLPASSKGDLTYGVAESALESSPRRRPRPHAACGLPSSRRLCLPVLRSSAPRTGILWWSTNPP